MVQEERGNRMKVKLEAVALSSSKAARGLAVSLALALPLLSGCATQSTIPQAESSCAEGYICSNFPGHVQDVIDKLADSDLGCKNPQVYLENHAINFKSPNGPDTLTCNEYYVDDSDFFFGQKFDVFESDSELNSYYYDACAEDLFMNEWLVSPNVIFSDVNYEEVTEDLATQATEILSPGFEPKKIGFACDLLN